jgi:hypothetical protein
MDPQEKFNPAAGRHSNPAERMIPALVLIAVGALFFLSNLHIIYFQDIWRFWPVVLIAVGLAKLVDSADGGSVACGVILLAVGGLFLAGNFGYLYLTWRTFWPLILIGLGLLMLFDRTTLLTGYRCKWQRAYTAGFMRESAVFGGGKRQLGHQDFQGGKMDAVFGGFEIDLRDAFMTADSVVLEINAVFGGAEVKIPRTWMAVVQGTGVFGAFTDSSTPPHPAEVPNPKRLIVRGSAVFGGVEVKN